MKGGLLGSLHSGLHLANVARLELARRALRAHLLGPLCIHVHLVGRQGLEPRISRVRTGYIAAYVCGPNWWVVKESNLAEPSGHRGYGPASLHTCLTTPYGGECRNRTDRPAILQGSRGCLAHSPKNVELQLGCNSSVDCLVVATWCFLTSHPSQVRFALICRVYRELRIWYLVTELHGRHPTCKEGVLLLN